MADYQQREEQQSGSTQTRDALMEPPANEAAEAQSNELQEAQAAEAERVAAARVEWESLLGDKIGGEAFELIREHVGYEALLGYAREGAQSMADALADGPASATDAGAAGGLMDEKSEAEAVNKMLAALAPALKDMAERWLQSESGRKVLKSISEWVEENPEAVTAIVGVAVIGAAVGAWVSNVDPGEIEKMFKLGEHVRAGGSIDPGPIQNLAIQAATLSVEYEADGLKASLTGRYDAEDGNSVTAKVEGEGQLGASEGQGTAEVTVHDDGRAHIAVNGELSTIIGHEPVSAGGGVTHTRGGDDGASTKVEGHIAVGEEGDQRRVEGTYDQASGAFTFQLSQEVLDGQASRTQRIEQDAEGNTTSSDQLRYAPAEGHQITATTHQSAEGTGQEVEYEGEDVGGTGTDVNARVGSGTHEGVGLGLGFDIGQFRTELDLEMGQAERTFGFSTEGEITDSTTLGGDARFDLNSGRLDEYGLKVGWRDPDAFRSFMLEYRGDWLDDSQLYEHQFNTAVEYSLGNLSGRLRGGVALQDGQVSGGHADALVGYQLRPDHAIIGGVGYEAQMEQGQMQHNVGIRAGYQYKDVAITVGFQPGQGNDDRFTIGLEIPLSW